MKTLDAKTIKEKKENLHAQFEDAKKKAVAHEKARAQYLEEMTRLQGAYKAMVELEKEMGIDPQLPANATKEGSDKK